MCVCVILSRTYAHSEWNIFNEKRETQFKLFLFIIFSSTRPETRPKLVFTQNDEIQFNLLLIIIIINKTEISYRKSLTVSFNGPSNRAAVICFVLFDGLKWMPYTHRRRVHFTNWWDMFRFLTQNTYTHTYHT